MEIIVLSVLLIGTSAGVTYFIQKESSKKIEEKLKLATNENDNKKIVDLEIESKKKISETKQRADEIEKKAIEKEKRNDEKEVKLIERSNSLNQRFEEIEKKEKAVEQSKIDIKKRSDQIQEELEKISSMTKADAEELLKAQVEEELKGFISKKIYEAEQKINFESSSKSKEILIDAMQRSATDFVAETTSTTFQIEDKDLKGKIIGKEGRNIRAFERLTGVDIMMDDAPDMVTVSSFDPIRREVAALTIQKLLKDGRVHPGAIEETVKNIKDLLAKEIVKTGEKIAYDAGFSDLPMEIIKLLGRFKYRFSYGQNLVKHSLEMVNLGQQIAQEIGADVVLTKKACLLHDLGKVLTYEIEGKPHHHISGDIVRKYLKDEVLANAVESHHGDIEPKSVEAVIVMIADSISGARPGARRDDYDDYVKRVKALEDIAKQYNSVKEAYAIHAGREIRVIVKPNEVSDEDARIIAHKIAKEIEEKQNYPGTVKVTLIRETRFEAEAK